LQTESFSSIHATPSTELYTLSLHDALPISQPPRCMFQDAKLQEILDGRATVRGHRDAARTQRIGERARAVAHQSGLLARLSQMQDRKSTRLNSSHLVISYAVFCLKKKK